MSAHYSDQSLRGHKSLKSLFVFVFFGQVMSPHHSDLTNIAGVTKKHQKFIFEYWVFSQKSYLNVWCFEKVHICIPKILYYICIPKNWYLHTKSICIFWSFDCSVHVTCIYTQYYVLICLDSLWWSVSDILTFQKSHIWIPALLKSRKCIPGAQFCFI